MATHKDVGRARIILEAVHLASAAELPTLHQLLARERETLQLELVLRILLTYLPESTEPTCYVELLHQLARGAVHTPSEFSPRPAQPGQELSDEEAQHQVRQLHLLPLAEEQDLQAGCTDILTLFLIHRARRIEAETGSIPKIQKLLEPFVDRDPYLRTWIVSNILPIRRLNYDYYPLLEDACTLEVLEKLAGRPAIDALLSRSVLNSNAETTQSARDIRGVVGPWIYGESRRKRRKTHHGRRQSLVASPSSVEQNASVEEEGLQSSWSDVNDWIIELALRDFPAAAKTIEQWDGPSDVDYDGYSEGYLDSNSSRRLTHQYAQAALGALYASPHHSVSVFDTSVRVLQKVAHLSDLEVPQPLQEAQTGSAVHISKEYIGQLSEAHLLHNALLRPDNLVTAPTQASLSFASFLVSSCGLFSKLDNPKSCRAAAGLASFSNREEQMNELHKTLQKVSVPTRDEESWAQVRHQILWLRDWQYQASATSKVDQKDSLGVFGRLSRIDVEVELLRAILKASHYDLAVHVYCAQDEHPIPVDLLEKTILGVVMSFYDSASNGNRKRGGMRKASEMLAAFQVHFPGSRSFIEADALLAATHSMSFYSLTLQHGVPFQPVNIRASKDPMSLIGKILEQNPRSYAKLDDLIEIGQNLVRSGLEPARTSSSSTKPTETADLGQDQSQQVAESSRRITSMAIEAALAEGDFDTAYSYIVNRLSPTVSASPSQTPTSQQDAESISTEDDISWRAAYLAGRFSPSRMSPSQASLRRLEQRLELLSLSLLLAPPVHLPEILQVWRAVESDLAALLAREAAEEDQWNSKGDRVNKSTTTVPGGFAPSAAEMDKAANQKPRRQSRATAAAATEEAPMGLFDVARGAAQAFSKNAFPLRAGAATTAAAAAAASGEGKVKARPLSMGSDGSESETKAERLRKRDMVANAVTGGLASGIGWVIGAPAPGKG